MSDHREGERMVLVDASVFITLTEIDVVDSLLAIDGRVVVPTPVANEITSEPANRVLESVKEAGRLLTMDAAFSVTDAAAHLGRELSQADLSGHSQRRIEGDTALLALALQREDVETGMTRCVVITDDKPLRRTCKALSIPVSGSIGVLVRAVERGDMEPSTGKEKLYAMDEVGARLSASLVRKAERLIEEAGEE